MPESIVPENSRTHILDDPALLALLPDDAVQAVALRERESHIADIVAADGILAVRDGVVASLQGVLRGLGEQLVKKDVEIADMKAKADKERAALVLKHEVNKLSERIERYKVHAASMIAELETILNSDQRFETMFLSKLAKPIGQMRAYVEDLEIDNYTVKTIGISGVPDVNALEQRLLEIEYCFKEALADIQAVSGREYFLSNVVARFFNSGFTDAEREMLERAIKALQKAVFEGVEK